MYVTCARASAAAASWCRQNHCSNVCTHSQAIDSIRSLGYMVGDQLTETRGKGMFYSC